MKRTLLTLFGLVILVGVLFVWGIAKRGQRSLQAVREADHARILAESQTLIAAADSRHPREERKSGAPWIEVFGRADPALFRHGMREIVSLKPSYVAVSDKEVMLCLSALPRIYVLAFRTNTQEYGSECITNGLWMSRDPARDRRNAETSRLDKRQLKCPGRRSRDDHESVPAIDRGFEAGRNARKR